MRCGRFQDALESLLSWLTDTEELVASQKPPSAEFKVVKAQIQEQKVRTWYRVQRSRMFHKQYDSALYPVHLTSFVQQERLKPTAFTIMDTQCESVRFIVSHQRLMFVVRTC